MASSTDDLLHTVEKLRSTKYEAIPPNLVKAIIQIEADFADDRVTASRKVGEALREFMGSEDEDA